MTDHVIRFGPVTHVPATGAPAGGGVVGGGNQWDDGSDSTYAVVWSRSSGGLRMDSAQAYTTADTLPASVDTATVTALTCTLRLSTTNAAPLANRYINAQCQAITGGTIAFNNTGSGVADWTVPNDDAVHTITGAVDETLLATTGRDLAWAAEQFKTATRNFMFRRSLSWVPNFTDVSATCFEAWITVTYGEEPPPAIRRAVPPLRQRPRSDGLASSSALRVWPASRSVQGSNRQGPGAYL